RIWRMLGRLHSPAVSVCSRALQAGTESKPMNKKFLNLIAPAGAVVAALLLLQMPAASQAPAGKAVKGDRTAAAGGSQNGDGRKFPKDEDIDPTWFGYSIGHIEGNTLVVETKGYNDKFWFDFRGTPHTELMTTVERYTRTDYGNLTVETTVTDPGAYSKPFT